VEDCAYERWVRVLHDLDRRVRPERKGRRYVEGRSASLCWCGFSLVALRQSSERLGREEQMACLLSSTLLVYYQYVVVGWQ
jgi:hypothetical protein